MSTRKRDKDNYTLALFNGSPTGTDMFKKSVQATQMIVQNGEMTGQQLLAWNILVKNAKKQKDYYENRGIERKDSEKTYTISRAELMERMDYKSTNRKPFKQALLNMQNIKVSWDVLNPSGGEMWASCVLLPYVACNNDTVTYSFVNHIEPMLFESPIYSHIDLAIQKSLNLDASKKLYDWISRYRTNPSHLTNKDPWGLWRQIVHGNTLDDSYTKEYKIFKRDKLKPALAEINEISDLIVELIEDKEGTRSVKTLQFKVHEKPKFSTETEEKQAATQPKFHLDKELAKLNITSYYKKKILASFDEATILANIKYTLARLKKNDTEINNQGAYLMAACQGKYGTEEVEDKAKTNDTAGLDVDNILAEINKQRVTDVIRMFAEMNETEQRKHINLYNETQTDKLSKVPLDIFKRKNFHLIPFHSWLATYTWGEPTAKEIIAFTLKKSKK